MLSVARRTFLLLGLLASALIAGFFYTYSISVMPGLDAADPVAAVRAMQGINATVRTAVFAFAFFGSLLFPVLAALFVRRRAVLVPLTAAILIYGAGAIAVTLLVNVPMNAALAAVQPSVDTAAGVWRDYADPWTWWNHARAIASVVSFGLVAAAVVQEWRA